MKVLGNKLLESILLAPKYNQEEILITLMEIRAMESDLKTRQSLERCDLNTKSDRMIKTAIERGRVHAV